MNIPGEKLMPRLPVFISRYREIQTNLKINRKLDIEIVRQSVCFKIWERQEKETVFFRLKYRPARLFLNAVLLIS